MFLGVVIAAISLIFFGCVDDQKSIELYLQKLQSLGLYRLDNFQERYVVHYYLRNQDRHPNLSRRHRVRAEFNAKKRQLKQEWCAHYAVKWPTETQRITPKGNSPTAVDFQAHHVIPINAGGINHWWNIWPISDRNHKKLHASLEERACFAHDILEQKIYRLILKIREIFYEFGEKLTNFKQDPRIRQE
ncbi:MAG: HNH endonuclease [Holosporaceae bacterium]|nr:HNH endonuclease [Holosporaceae bacterium]